jgi:hypothetical protein
MKHECVKREDWLHNSFILTLNVPENMLSHRVNGFVRKTPYGYVRRVTVGGHGGWSLQTCNGFKCGKDDVLLTWGALKIVPNDALDDLPRAWEGYACDWLVGTSALPDIEATQISIFGPCLINAACSEKGETENVKIVRDVAAMTLEIVAITSIGSYEPILLSYGDSFDEQLRISREKIAAERRKSRLGVPVANSRRCKVCRQWYSKRQAIQHHNSHK